MTYRCWEKLKSPCWCLGPRPGHDLCSGDERAREVWHKLTVQQQHDIEFSYLHGRERTQRYVNELREAGKI